MVTKKYIQNALDNTQAQLEAARLSAAFLRKDAAAYGKEVRQLREQAAGFETSYYVEAVQYDAGGHCYFAIADYQSPTLELIKHWINNHKIDNGVSPQVQYRITEQRTRRINEDGLPVTVMTWDA
jgi:hypothetical protein